MQKELNELLELAKLDKKGFMLLKTTAVKLKAFEFASKLKAMEDDLFPVTPEIKQAKQLAEELSAVFRMVNLKIDPPTAWLIGQTVDAYKRKRGKLSINDTADLITKSEQIFEL